MNQTNRVFLDYASTTPIHPDVADLISRIQREIGGNPSSIHEEGRRARHLIESSREKVADLLSITPAEVVFTSSATEAINTVLKSWYWGEKPGKPFWSTRAEHQATVQTLRFLEGLGATVHWMPLTKAGAVLGQPDSSGGLVSLMAVNNELGTVLPEPIIQTMQSAGCKIHLDGVQLLGKLPLVMGHPVDYLSFSGHKIDGPRGIGLLIVRSGNELTPLLHGGSQERNRRSGTEATAAIAGFALALELALTNQTNRLASITKINSWIRNELAGWGQMCRINSPVDGSPWILNLTLFTRDGRPVDGESVIMALDAKGISVSNGSACSSGSFEPSHVLEAVGMPAEEARGSLRISFHHQTTRTELAQFLTRLEEILNRLNALH